MHVCVMVDRVKSSFCTSSLTAQRELQQRINKDEQSTSRFSNQCHASLALPRLDGVGLWDKHPWHSSNTTCFLKRMSSTITQPLNSQPLSRWLCKLLHMVRPRCRKKQHLCTKTTYVGHKQKLNTKSQVKTNQSSIDNMMFIASLLESQSLPGRCLEASSAPEPP